MNLDAETVAPWLNRLPFVRWDRFVRAELPQPEQFEDEQSLVAYGWIDRPDGRADFVVLEFTTWAEVPGFSTSSAERSEEIARLLSGDDAPHFPCERVEDFFGELVPNKVALEPRPRARASVEIDVHWSPWLRRVLFASSALLHEVDEADDCLLTDAVRERAAELRCEIETP